MDWLEKLTVAAALIGIFTAMGYVGEMDYHDALERQRHYCDSVSRFERSNGLEGHPAYDEWTVCNEDNSR